MTNVLFAGGPNDWEDYEQVLPSAFRNAGLDVDLQQEMEASVVDYIVYAPDSGLTNFSQFPALKGVFGLWAGVEKVVGNPTLNVPLCRMVDAGLTEGMIEWCLGHVMRHHLEMDQDILRQDAEWVYHIPPLARQRRVCVLGLGALGQGVVEVLRDLRFQVTGWSRSQKDITGVTCHSGEEGLHAALAKAEILVLLLPQTPATDGILNAKTMSALPKGAVVINPGRGPLIIDEDLLAALDSGQISHATLDVFREEPLPKDHPFWAHLNVTVTPHVASATRPDTAAEVIAENIRRAVAGEPLLNLVDRAAGY